jgi:cytochrome b subunit of formate dehydrogenase
MITCPRCKGAAMTLGEKALLGPGRAVRCRACGGRIATHWVGIFAALPAFLGGFAFLKADTVPLGLMFVLAGVAGMALLQTYVVPLMKVE